MKNIFLLILRNKKLLVFISIIIISLVFVNLANARIWIDEEAIIYQITPTNKQRILVFPSDTPISIEKHKNSNNNLSPTSDCGRFYNPYPGPICLPYPEPQSTSTPVDLYYHPTPPPITWPTWWPETPPEGWPTK